MRFVLDTNVLVAALRSDRGASRRLLLSALSGEIQAIVSVPLMIEYESVLTRPHQLALPVCRSGKRMPSWMPFDCGLRSRSVVVPLAAAAD